MCYFKRSTIFQDVILSLMNAFTRSSSTLIIKLVLTTLTEFCSTSTTYDADFIKRQLISHKIIGVSVIIINYY